MKGRVFLPRRLQARRNGRDRKAAVRASALNPRDLGESRGDTSFAQVWSIEPGRMPLAEAARELWDHRELLYFLTWRDIKVRYKQTALGASWAVLQPLLTMLIFSVVFGRLAKIPSDGVPYPLFAFTALLPWTFFSNAVSFASMSLVATPDLVTKVYFPRVAMPIASVLGGLIDLALGFLVLIGMLAYYGVAPGTKSVVVVPLVILAFTVALGVALWLSALNVEYRDVRYAIPFLLQFWLFATPVAYPSSLVEEPWRTLFGLNPMTGVVEGFRWALLDTSTAPGPMVAVSAAVAVGLLLTGLFYFRRVESRFADVI
jgi:lipopolysaccharide transport system permease protein